MSVKRELVVTPLATVRTRRQRWAWKDLIPLDVATILAGRGGIGKSTVLAWITAELTRGGLPGDFLHGPVNVGVISAEDDAATSLVPRLQAAGADLGRIHDFSAVRSVDEADGSTWTGLPTIADDLADLRDNLKALDIRVLIIDPIASMMSGDSIKASDVRRNLDPIAGLAAGLGIAVVLVAHFGKGGGDASDKLSGSHVFRDVARSLLLLAVDEETNQRVLTVDKANYSQLAPSLAFTIESVNVETDDNETAKVGLAHLIGTTTLTVHEIVRRGNDDSLGDLSTSILEFVNDHPEGVDTSAVVEELDLPRAQARVYLGRLVASDRIDRLGRGKYAPKATTHPPVTPVATVTTVAFDYSDVTDATGIHPYRGGTMLRPILSAGNAASPSGLRNPENQASAARRTRPIRTPGPRDHPSTPPRPPWPSPPPRSDRL